VTAVREIGRSLRFASKTDTVLRALERSRDAEATKNIKLNQPNN